MPPDRSHRPLAELDRYESLVLRALGIEEEAAPIARWAAVYAEISESLTLEAPKGPSALAHSRFEAADVAAVWGLVYGARTFEVATRVFREHPPASGGFVELGAGWGSGALAAAEIGSIGAVRLVDLSAERLGHARRLFEVAGRPSPSTEVADARAVGGLHDGTSICLPYSFGEIFPDPNARTAANWANGALRRLGPEGRIYIFEPGSKASARRLQALRDAMADETQILAPCTGAQPCPLLTEPEEWCHFTWPFRPGPVTRALMELSGRRWQELHVTWLVLGAPSRPRSTASPPRARILETRPEGRTRLRWSACTPQGVLKLTAITRTEDFRARVSQLASGALMELDTAELERKGDGLRLEPTTPLKVLVPG